MNFKDLTKNQKRIFLLLFNHKGEYWIQKQYSNNKQGFLWRLNYYCDEHSDNKINNWSVNALIKKGWFEVYHDETAGLYGIDYAVVSEKGSETYIINKALIK